MYNVSELRKNIAEKVLGLGVDQKFKENPAFSSALAKIDSLIGQMNMFEDAERVMVTVENGVVSFEWTSRLSNFDGTFKEGTKYSMQISCSKPEEFRCIKVEEKKPWLANNGQMVREKDIFEIVTSIDKNGNIVLTKNNASLNDIGCQRGRCNNIVSSEKSDYTSSGVMRECEYKLSSGPLEEDISNAMVSSALFVPRQYYDFGFWHNRYSFREKLVRCKFDTARYIREDKEKGIFYSGEVKLSGEHGYRDMVTQGGNFDYPTDYTIEPLSPEDIDRAISKESNPKVAEALRELAKGRENYRYVSREDPHFQCNGVKPEGHGRK